MRLSLIFLFVKPISVEFHIFLLLKMNYDYLVMDNSRKILADHKVSVTNPRIVVLEALLEIKSPITVDELLSQLRSKVAKSTLYRVLNDLKDINILHEFSTPDNQTVVELILEDHSHHHHLFCSDCGEIIDVEMATDFENKLLKEIKRIEKKFNFVIEDHRLELFGKCTDLCMNCK
ncbi:transcriptional repressor [Acidimicrobiaceae bacterium]|nr:transcriptional repressor [Acidimicrobiaceae bacterium]